MSMSCWKTLGSPPLSRSSTTLKAFDRRTYTLYGILSNFQVELGGKTIEIDVEVIDGNLNYNILLGRPWIYAMASVVSTYFLKDFISFSRRNYNCRPTNLSPQQFTSYGKHSDHPWKLSITSKYHSRPAKRAYIDG